MKRLDPQQLAAYLDRAAHTVQVLRTLDLAAEHDFQQALEDSQHLLAVVAMYRHQLKHLAAIMPEDNLAVAVLMPENRAA